MARRSMFARGKRRLQASPGLAQADASQPGAAPAPATGPPRPAGPGRLILAAGAIYAAVVLAAGVGATLDWALGLMLPMPPVLFGLLLPLAVLYGFSYDIVYRLKWVDAAGLVRASFLVALLLAAIAASLHGAVLGPDERAKAAGTGLGLLASWLVILLAALNHSPPEPDAAAAPGESASATAESDDHSPVTRG